MAYLRGDFSMTASVSKLGRISPTRNVGTQITSVVGVPCLLAVSLVITQFSLDARAETMEQNTAVPGISAPSQTQSGQQSVNSLSTQISAPESRRIRLLEWKLRLDGGSEADQKQQIQSVGLGLGSRMRYRLLEGLEIKAEGAAVFQSGYAQLRLNDDGPKNSLRLKEAVVQYQPISKIALAAGAVNQDLLQSQYVTGKTPFLGIMERGLIGNKQFSAELVAEQAIPTSTTLSTESVDNESTPSFMAQTLILKSEPLAGLALKVWANHYAYSGLPSSVASKSVPWGNSVHDDGPNTSKFQFQFDGFSGGASSKIKLTRGLDWLVSTEIVDNTSAPGDVGMAQVTDTSLDIALPKDINIIPKGGIFFIESDIAPAYYLSAFNGETNRSGWFASLESVFKPQKFKARLDYVNSDVINSTLLQTKAQSIMLTIETLYEIF
jgi:hypothetical protein